MDPEEVEVKKADRRKWIIGAATVRATRIYAQTFQALEKFFKFQAIHNKD